MNQTYLAQNMQSKCIESENFTPKKWNFAKPLQKDYVGFIY